MTDESDVVLTSSPVLGKKQLELSFPDAMREVLNGKRIMRLAWAPEVTFCLLKDTFLQIFIRGEYHTWTINDGDMSGTDWVVLPDQN